MPMSLLDLLHQHNWPLGIFISIPSHYMYLQVNFYVDYGQLRMFFYVLPVFLTYVS